MTTAHPVPTVTLAGGIELPMLGFGTWQLVGGDAERAVGEALEIGYRSLDTATGYGNERQVGKALARSGVARDDVFITTKCPPDHAGRARRTLEASLVDLGVDRVDCWLIHWPPAAAASVAMWHEFVQAKADGLTRTIGVSNFSLAEIDELTRQSGEAPAMNQIPWSPFRYDAELAEGHTERGVVLEGYSPLKLSNLHHPVLSEIAEAHAVSPGQVVLRWHLEHGFVVIPKSGRRERIEENFAIIAFSLSAAEVERLDGLAGA